MSILYVSIVDLQQGKSGEVEQIPVVMISGISGTGQIGQQDLGVGKGMAPSGQRVSPQSISEQSNSEGSGQLGQQSPGLVTGIASPGHLGHGQPQAILEQGLAAGAGQLGQQSPGFVSGIAPSGQEGQPHVM